MTRTTIMQFCLWIPLSLFFGCASSDPVPERPTSRFRGEEAPIFHTSDLLRPEVVRGPSYRIAEEVPVVDYNFLFTIETRFGEIPAQGMNMLELRLREMIAIERAAAFSDDPHIVEGAVDSLKKAGEGLDELLTNPGGALLRAPRGFKSMVRTTFGESDRRAGGKTRRQLAARLGCDPETQNPVLKKLLDEITLQRKIGSLGAGQAAGIFIPGLTLLTATADIKRIVASTPPHEINQRIEANLASVGVDEYLRETFVRERSYTTMQRLIFMQHLGRLRGVENPHILVAHAIDVRNEAEGLAVINEVRLLADLHELYRLQRFLDGEFSTAQLADGRIIAVVDLDYIHNTDEVSEAVLGLRDRFAEERLIFLTTGRLSPQALQTFREAQITVLERGRLP